MKRERPFRLQITFTRETQVIAAVISLIAQIQAYNPERILKTVCAHYGYRVERV